MLIAARNAMLAGGGSQPSGGYWGLCFTAEQANSTVAMVANGSAPSVNLLYSTDAANWQPFVVGTTTVTLASVGDKVWLKARIDGNAAMGSITSSNTFTLSGQIAASGSIMSLLNGEAETFTISSNGCFEYLFNNCTSLTAAPELPATTLPTSGCYVGMFKGCTSMTAAPELPATTLKSNCYSEMFRGCTSLSSIKVGFSSFGTRRTNNWVDGVAATGTFYCPTALGTNDTISRGVSACPEGWTVINTDAA